MTDFTFTASYIKDRGKVIFATVGLRDYCIPKSLIKKQAAVGIAAIEITVPEWFAKKELPFSVI